MSCEFSSLPPSETLASSVQRRATLADQACRAGCGPMPVRDTTEELLATSCVGARTYDSAAQRFSGTSGSTSSGASSANAAATAATPMTHASTSDMPVESSGNCVTPLYQLFDSMMSSTGRVVSAQS